MERAAARPGAHRRRMAARSERHSGRQRLSGNRTHPRAIVTTRGWLTEPLWEQSGAVDLVDAGDPGALAQSAERLLRDRSRREQLSSRACALYDARFDVRHTIAVLRSENARSVPTEDHEGTQRPSLRSTAIQSELRLGRREGR